MAILNGKNSARCRKSVEFVVNDVSQRVHPKNDKSVVLKLTYLTKTYNIIGTG